MAIDFSTPETAFNNISHAIKHNIPIISGTTGWLEKLEEIKKLCTEFNGSFLRKPSKTNTKIPKCQNVKMPKYQDAKKVEQSD